MKIDKYLKLNPAFGVITAAGQLTKLLNQSLSSHGLNYSQSLILLSLFFEKDQTATPSELMQSLDISKGGMSQNLTQLESLKLIQRLQSPHDPRAHQIHLKPKAEEVCIQLVCYFDELQNRSEGRTSEQYIKGFLGEVQQIVEDHSL